MYQTSPSPLDNDLQRISRLNDDILGVLVGHLVGHLTRQFDQNIARLEPAFGSHTALHHLKR